MRYFIVMLSFGFFLTSCTKEVPEAEKKQLKSYEEKSVRQTIENFTAAYNSNDMEKAVSFFESDYKGTVGDSEEISGLEPLKNDLIQYRKQYAEGIWEVNIEEVGISGEQAYALTNSSFLMPDPIERKLNPIYSERAIRILKKQKNDGWKIYRYLATPTFTYDRR